MKFAVRGSAGVLGDFHVGNNNTSLFVPKFSVTGETGNETFSGDIASNGVGKRFRANFSDITLNNRFMFQDSATNSFTTVATIPSGTSTGSSFKSYSRSNADSSSSISMTSYDTENVIASNQSGTASLLPIKIRMNSENIITMAATSTYDITMHKPVIMSSTLSCGAITTSEVLTMNGITGTGPGSCGAITTS